MESQNRVLLLVLLISALFVPHWAANIDPHVGKRSADDRCSQPIHPGMCGEWIPRFFFDSHFGDCVPFIYSGCGGNENNFKTEEECEESCLND